MLLIVTGAVGAGKTTVGYEVATVLAARGIPHTFVDFDALTDTFPVPPDDRFQTRLALANLRDVWRNCEAAGSCNLIVAQVVETVAFRDAMVAAVGAPSSLLVRLRASVATLQRRVAQRDAGSGLEWHIARAAELAEQFERNDPSDLVIDVADHSVIDLARELAGLVVWDT